MANLKNLKVSSVSYGAIRESAAADVEHAAMMNATPTAEKAPYLPHVIPAGSVDLDALCAQAAGRIGCTFEEARWHWNTQIELAAKLFADGTATSIDFGYWRLALAVEGSVPRVDAACTKENAVYVNVIPSRELQDAAARITTRTDAASAPFQLKEVFETAGHNPWLVSGGEFYLFGIDLTMGGADEGVAIAGTDGVERACAVTDATDLPTRLTLLCPAGLAAGRRYKLKVTARGRAGAEPVTLEKANVVVKAAAPAPDPVDPPEIYLVQCADEPEGKIHAHGEFMVDGAHLANGALALLDADGRAIATPTDVVPTDARISARLDYDGDVSLVKTVKVTTPGGTATMNVRVLA